MLRVHIAHTAKNTVCQHCGVPSLPTVLTVHTANDSESRHCGVPTPQTVLALRPTAQTAYSVNSVYYRLSANIAESNDSQHCQPPTTYAAESANPAYSADNVHSV